MVNKGSWVNCVELMVATGSMAVGKASEWSNMFLMLNKTDLGRVFDGMSWRIDRT
jgi:hypothetical protein